MPIRVGHCLWALLCLAMAGCATLAPREARVDFTLGALLGEITTSEDGAVGRIRELLPAPEDPHERVYAGHRPDFMTRDGYRIGRVWLNINPNTAQVFSFSLVMDEDACFPLVELPEFERAYKRPVLHGSPPYVWEIGLPEARVRLSTFTERPDCLRSVFASLRNQWVQ